MAFNIANLVLVGHGNGFKHYRYKTTDGLATVLASAYFGKDSTTGQQSSDMLAAGDLIMVEASDGFQMLRVDTVSSTTVTTEVGFGETSWVSVPILDFSASGGVYIAAPFDGVIGRAKLVTNGEVGTTNTVRVLNAAGAAAITFALDQSGQGAGEVYQARASSNNTVTEGDAIQVVWTATDAQAQAAEADAMVMIEFIPV